MKIIKTLLLINFLFIYVTAPSKTRQNDMSTQVSNRIVFTGSGAYEQIKIWDFISIGSILKSITTGALEWDNDNLNVCQLKKEELKVNGIVIPEAKGLFFDCPEGKMQIESKALRLNQPTTTSIYVPNLKKGDSFVITWRSTNSTEERGFNLSNLSKTQIVTNANNKTEELTVLDDGEVVLTLTGGVRITRIEILRTHDIIASGTCGDNTKWMLTDDYKLYISGFGKMKDYSEISHTPWYYYAPIITSVTIENGITNIGDYTFFGCYKLNHVEISSSITKIGYFAFGECHSLSCIYCLAESIPVTDSTSFGDINDNTILYIPGTAKNYYLATMPWNKFTIKSIIIPINDRCGTYENIETQKSGLSYIRLFTSTNWQAFYVPFCMTYDDWKDDFEVAYINNVNQYDDDEDGTIDRTVMEVIKMKEGKSIEPNTPYLIKAKTAGEKTITLEDATLYKTEETTYSVTSWFNSFNFVGTYHTISDMATKGYYAMSDGALKQAISDTATLNPFRWYLSVTDRNGNPVSLNSKSMSIVFDDGETTGIENVNNEKSNSSIHTLTGISKGSDVKTLVPGIYIKNGKKFIVK